MVVTSRNYYEILGVSHKSSPRQIRRAYCVLARKYHPDLNRGDEVAAQDFREIQEAYEVLSDLRKRKAYDYYGPAFGNRIPVQNIKPVEHQPAPRAPDTFGSFPRVRMSDRFWSGGLSPLAMAALGRAVFAGVFLAGAFIYFSWPNAGIREFRRAQEALRHVNSWKVQSGKDPAGQEYLNEVSCPSSERETRNIWDPSAGQTTFKIETVTIRYDRYTHDVRSENWAQYHVTEGPAETCALLRNGKDSKPLPPFGEWLRSAYSITEAGLRQAGGEKCREWRILLYPGSFATPAQVDFVCLGVRDHLPRFRGVPGTAAEVRFYDWNVPIDIQPAASFSKTP